ncbi:hypothetical protein Pint_22967 [Pistacia integerrima]|uniref:Uncharacterized protein n=2 Tax=Pistacia TaxID=55512 RepID=A0ACC1B6R6_9ROSI|nr:hypothetical protein Pint_22967 [Pistacia integerrima]KAJ0094593.1 hypothetical protein Patl1_16127 [Pistacia atlantica]
MVTHFLHCHP